MANATWIEILTTSMMVFFGMFAIVIATMSVVHIYRKLMTDPRSPQEINEEIKHDQKMAADRRAKNRYWKWPDGRLWKI